MRKGSRVKSDTERLIEKLRRLSCRLGYWRPPSTLQHLLEQQVDPERLWPRYMPCRMTAEPEAVTMAKARLAPLILNGKHT